MAQSFRKDWGNVWIIELRSDESQESFRNFLVADVEEVDPVVQVTFGPPMNPFISPAAQVEVWNVISTYQPLKKEAFLPGAPQILWIPIPNGNPPAGVQYHHAQIALQKVQEEIEHPDRLTNNLPLLQGMDAARVICDFTIVYANCIIVRRLYRRH